MSFFSQLSRRESDESNLFAAAFNPLIQSRPYLTLTIIGAILYCAWLSAEPLRTHIEANRVQASWEMFHHGDWVVPTLNNELYLAKPPFQYWLINLLSLPFGDVHTWTARFLSGASTVAVMWMIFGFARRRIGDGLAFWSALLFALSPLIIEKGPRAELEALLTAVTTASVFCLWKSALSPKPWRWAIASGIMLGAANLIKGPVPWLFFACAWIGLLWGAADRKRAGLTGLVALLLSLLCLVPWAAALFSRLGWETIKGVIEWEVVERTYSDREIIQEPFWYYIESLAKGLFPWSLLAPGLAFLPWKQVSKRNAFLGILAGWAIGAAIAFSFFSGKETRYLISSYPAWAILLVWGWSLMPGEGLSSAYRQTLGFAARWIAPLLIYAGAIAVLAFFQPVHNYILGYGFYALLVVGVANIDIAMRMRMPNWLLISMLVVLIGAKGFWSEGFMKERRLSYPFAEMGEEIDSMLADDEPLVTVGIYRAFIQYAVQHPFIHFTDWDSFKEQANELEGRYVLVDRKRIPDSELDTFPLKNRFTTKRDEYLLFLIEIEKE